MNVDNQCLLIDHFHLSEREIFTSISAVAEREVGRNLFVNQNLNIEKIPWDLSAFMDCALIPMTVLNN